MRNISVAVCRSLPLRNFTGLSSSLSSNHSSIGTVEWLVHGLSFLIFFAALVGNTAALIVMFTPRGRIQLTNDKYLTNLAIADLLRTCFIPFTVVARMKRNFIFGRAICKILPVVQGTWIQIVGFLSCKIY